MSDEPVTEHDLSVAAGALVEARADGRDHSAEAATLADLRRRWRLQEIAAGRRDAGATVEG